MITTPRRAPWADHGHFLPGDTVVYLDPGNQVCEATVTRPDHVQREDLHEVLVVGDARHRFRHEVGCRSCSADRAPGRHRTARIITATSAVVVAAVATSAAYACLTARPRLGAQR